jgi:cytochrome c-type biogenesis protein CcmH
MTTFYIVAGAMVVIGLALVIPTLIFQQERTRADRESLNISIFKQRLGELQRDLDSELISADQFAATKAELERGLLDDVGDTPSAVRRSGGAWAAIVIALITPLFAALMYQQVGNPEIISMPLQQRSNVAVAQAEHNVEEMVNTLKARLQTNPDDAEGWYMLGRTYVVLERFMDALPAFERAQKLVGEQPEILVAYAEAIALSTRGALEGRPLEMAHKALEMDPNNEKGLWMAGVGDFHGGRIAEAVEHWQKLDSVLTAGSEQQQRTQLASRGEALPTTEAAATPAAASSKVEVQVSIDPAVLASAKPSDIVFIFARAQQGPPMPLAVVRKTVADLPVRVTLDESMSMMPQLSLATVKQVVVGARVSKSGSATPQAGDIEGIVQGVTVNSGEPVRVVINTLRP